MNEPIRSLGQSFIPPEKAAGFAFAMGLWDLSLDCRVEPDLFAVDKSGQIRVLKAELDGYVEAIETALAGVDAAFENDAIFCAFAYQGFVKTESSRRRAIMVRCFWVDSMEVLVHANLIEAN